MKGVVFNLLESFISEGWGDEKYEEILALCPLATKEPFVGPGTYPDSDLLTIAEMAANRLGLPLPDALRAFGKYCFPRLAEKVPLLVSSHRDAQGFLKSVESVIHVEVRKLMPQAVTPRFGYRQLSENELLLEYDSARRLCALFEGLLQGVAVHFSEAIHCEHVRCVHSGQSACEFRLRFDGRVERAA